MKRLILLTFILASLTGLSTNKKGKEPKYNAEEPAYVEAVVIAGTDQCGYLLELSNGQLIKPDNLPRKYQHYAAKVMVILNDVKAVEHSPCDVQKEAHIASIHYYKLNTRSRTKY